MRPFKKKGFEVKYWEIGNENHGNWEPGHQPKGKEKLNGKIYGQDIRKIAAAMKKEDPSIYIGADVVRHDDGSEWVGFFWWMRDLLPEIKDVVDYIVPHEYFQWPYDGDMHYVSPSNETLLKNIEQVQMNRDSLHKIQDKYADGKRFPILLNEFNIVNATSKQTIQAINMIFTAAVLGESIRVGLAGASIWDWRNDFDPNHHGDMGMLSIGDKRIPDATPRPSYYAFAIHEKAMGGEMVASKVKEGKKGKALHYPKGVKLRSYASNFSNGERGLVLINQSESPVRTAIQTKGSKAASKINAWVADSKWGLNSTKVRFNTQEGPEGGGGPFPLSKIKPFSLETDKNGNLILIIPPVSVTGLVFYP